MTVNDLRFYCKWRDLFRISFSILNETAFWTIYLFIFYLAYRRIFIKSSDLSRYTIQDFRVDTLIRASCIIIVQPQLSSIDSVKLFFKTNMCLGNCRSRRLSSKESHPLWTYTFPFASCPQTQRDRNKSLNWSLYRGDCSSWSYIRQQVSIIKLNIHLIYLFDIYNYFF